MVREVTERVVAERYLVRRLLGRGGMGVVWEADDTVLSRRVAIKEVEIPLAVGAEADSVAARVLREARAAARLNHACAVTTFDVIRDDDRVYIVMELVEFPTLTEVVLKEGPLAPERAAAIGAQVAEVLASAHERGIVHRDVKPGNLMVGQGDRVKLADFGIASVKDDSRITATGLVLGSPSFMAPEQAQGAVSGPAVDTWALGATLFYAVEGAPPFDKGSAIATLAAAASEEPPPPERAGPLGPVISEMLAKEAEARPSDSDLIRKLREVAGGAEATRKPQDPFDHALPVIPRWAPSKEVVPEAVPSAAEPSHVGRWILVAAVVVALLGGLWFVDALRTEAELGREGPRAASGDTGGGGTAASGDSGSGNSGSGNTGESLDAGGSGATADTEGSESSGGETSPATGEVESETVPSGTIPPTWESYTDPDTGYALAYPEGWTVRPQSASATTTDFVDPETGTYLRVDWTGDPGPSPEAAWEQQSDSFAQSHADYSEIRIDPTTYQGFEAALWEYSYSDGGAELHAYNLGFVTPDMGFALNFQTRSENWDESQALFERFKATFQVPGQA
jgi:eukaryotic-like serine/threonine-protein kinase